jgi:hypothetical protein
LGELSGVVVHDRYANYDSKVFAGLVHQLCTAHILRDLADAAECLCGANTRRTLCELVIRRYRP